jgi:hypothetical protein
VSASRSGLTQGLVELSKWIRRSRRSTLPDDTHLAIQTLLIDGYRAMSPAQKLERAQALNHTVQQLALMDIRRRHPNADEREQALRLASGWIEPDLMLRAFGWDVRKEGYRCQVLLRT